MSIIKFFLTVLSMNVIFNRVTAQEKKQLRKLDNKGKAFMRPEIAVPFNEIWLDNNLLPKFAIC